MKAARKLPPKAPKLFFGDIVTTPGNELCVSLRVAVIPDHYNREARRWKLAYEKRNWCILSRSEATALAREWREDGSPQRQRERGMWICAAAVNRIRRHLEQLREEAAAA